jgi:hypothetical protein
VRHFFDRELARVVELPMMSHRLFGKQNLEPRKRWSSNERNCRDSRVTEFDELGIENVVLFVFVHNITSTANFASCIKIYEPE